MVDVGAGLIGLGSGLFAHATLTAAMAQARTDTTGVVLGVVPMTLNLAIFWAAVLRHVPAGDTPVAPESGVR